eukprot:5616403-Prymnesium_polylepis.1
MDSVGVLVVSTDAMRRSGAYFRSKNQKPQPGANTGAVSTTIIFGQECVDTLGRHTGNTHRART